VDRSGGSSPYENFLRNVFGQFARACHLQSKAIDAPLMATIKISEALFISAEHSLYEFVVSKRRHRAIALDIVNSLYEAERFQKVCIEYAEGLTREGAPLA
jgi:hypothetical protein